MAHKASKFPLIPASFFGIVLGLVGLGGSWRAAHEVWGLPSLVGEAVMLAGGIVWAVLVVLFAAKWLTAREEAVAEARHPVQCCFIGLAGVATMLVAIAVQPYAALVAIMFFMLGGAFTLGFALWRTGVLWQGGRDPTATTPVLYLPTVAGSYVVAMSCAALGFPEWGRLAFGAGVLSWLAIESVLVHRLYTLVEMPAAMRPTLGIQLAPPTVGAAAYVSVTSGPPDTLILAMIGYGIFQILLLVRLSRWIFAAGFAASAWSFSFGLTALSTALVKLADRGAMDPITALAPVVFVLVSAVLAALVLRTLWLVIRGRILPATAGTVAVSAPSTPA